MQIKIKTQEGETLKFEVDGKQDVIIDLLKPEFSSEELEKEFLNKYTKKSLYPEWFKNTIKDFNFNYLTPISTEEEKPKAVNETIESLKISIELKDYAIDGLCKRNSELKDKIAELKFKIEVLTKE